jgi:hypothetical protein
MLIVLLLVLLVALGAAALASLAVSLHALWSAVPQRNADFEWLDV